MSAHYPILAVTGSSGAGTTTALRVFERIFAELGLSVATMQGDSFHAHDRERWRGLLRGARIRGERLSLFGPQGNLWARLEQAFAEYSAQGTGRLRRYLHTEAEADAAGQNPGSFTPWEPMPERTDLLFYEGLFGGLVSREADVARYVDLLVGVVPIVNLEWIQKIHRDTEERGYSADEVQETILRRLPDYVHYITPQFSRSDINFQRVPLVDTSNPFAPQRIPTAEESLVVIHVQEHCRYEVDFKGLLASIPKATMTAERTVVVPGPAQEAAMYLLLKDFISQLVQRRARAWQALADDASVAA